MKTIGKLHRFWLSAASAVLLLLSLNVQANEHPAQALIEKTIDDVLQLLSTEKERIKTDPDFLYAQMEQHVFPLIDFKSATGLAVGKYWRKASDQQKIDLTQEFRTLLLRTYSNAIKSYGGEKIEFLAFRPEKRDDRAKVRSIFKPKQGNNIPVTYRMREKQGEWLVYDIIVDNLSLVTTYRGTFSSEISKNGIDGLIASLRDKNGS